MCSPMLYFLFFRIKQFHNNLFEIIFPWISTCIVFFFIFHAYALEDQLFNHINVEMETQLVAEFVSKTKASPNDALSCLRTWGWDLKKALIDYNGKYSPICQEIN